MKKGTLSQAELIQLVCTIAISGPSQVAETQNVSFKELQTLLRDSYMDIIGGATNNTTCPITLDSWAKLDPEYLPPRYLMDELNTLIQNFIVGFSLFNLGVNSSLLSQEKISEFIDATIDRGEAACKFEVSLAVDMHRVCHIQALSTSFSLSILQVMRILLNDIPVKKAPKEHILCDTLCGFVDCYNESLQGGKGAINKAKKKIKRHGLIISQSELADMSRTTVANIASTLTKIEKAMNDCSLASAIDAAETAGVDVDAYKSILPPNDDTEWYDEDSACKFLNVSSLLQLPEDIRPKKTFHNGAIWFSEAELERSDKLRSQPDRKTDWFYLWEVEKMLERSDILKLCGYLGILPVKKDDNVWLSKEMVTELFTGVDSQTDYNSSYPNNEYRQL